MLTTPRLLLNLKSAPAQNHHHPQQRQNTLTPSQQRDVFHQLNGAYHAQNINTTTPPPHHQQGPPIIHHPQTIQIPMLGTLQVPPPQPNPQGNQGPPPQQQNPLGQPGQGQPIPPPPPQNGQDFTLSSVLHFLQTEWRRYERDRNEWEIERAEMRVRLLRFLFAYTAPCLSRSGSGLETASSYRPTVFSRPSRLSLDWTRLHFMLSCAPCSFFCRHASPFSRASVVRSRMSNWISCDVSRCSSMPFAWNGELAANALRSLAHVLDFFSRSTFLYTVQNNLLPRRRQQPRPS